MASIHCSLFWRGFPGRPHRRMPNFSVDTVNYSGFVTEGQLGNFLHLFAGWKDPDVYLHRSTDTGKNFFSLKTEHRTQIYWTWDFYFPAWFDENVLVDPHLSRLMPPGMCGAHVSPISEDILVTTTIIKASNTLWEKTRYSHLCYFNEIFGCCSHSTNHHIWHQVQQAGSVQQTGQPTSWPILKIFWIKCEHMFDV